MPLSKIARTLAIAIMLLGRAAGSGQGPTAAPVATTPHFAFYNNLETNLNDALIAAGVARRHRRPELFHTGREQACFDGQSPSARVAWDRAVDYYEEIISPAKWSDRQQYLLRAYLAGFPDRPTDDRSRQFVEIADSFRRAAEPAWQACRWPAQEEENSRFIEELQPRLAAHEEAIARRLEALYEKRWSGLPIRVDVVETVDWSGANTIILDPAGGHILVSNSYRGPQTLEIVFHEASHLLMGPRDPVRQSLDAAARSAGVTLPRDLWHVVLFYMTGEVVHETLEKAGEAGYSPILYEIFERNSRWQSYRGPIEGSLPAYVNGSRSLAEAAADLVRALPAHPPGAAP